MTARQLFHYPITDCDVSDPAALAAFRAKITEWDELINGDPTHAIRTQISVMMWQDAAWRSANEARRFAEADGANASTAPLLAEMLDRGYVAGQIIAITRLIEPSDPKQPKKAVVSLRRLVDEARAARALITREHFVAQDALPYAWEPIAAAEAAAMAARTDPATGVSVGSLDMSGPRAWDMAQLQHETFDQLSGVAADQRGRHDQISDMVFDRLAAALDDPIFSDIRALRHKTVAHAADSFSRAQVPALRSGLNLVEFARAHYLLTAVYQALSVILLGQWRGAVLPVAQHDQFARLSEPFVTAHRLGDLQAFWASHEAEREQWMEDAYHEIVPRAPSRLD